ncbi:MAG TPA: hypothetical protein PK867_30580, partial [Pirellulales bacterium]|nr:hypothetical protein [Pirellulales bacterium]
ARCSHVSKSPSDVERSAADVNLIAIVRLSSRRMKFAHPFDAARRSACRSTTLQIEVIPVGLAFLDGGPQLGLLQIAVARRQRLHDHRLALQLQHIDSMNRTELKAAP